MPISGGQKFRAVPRPGQFDSFTRRQLQDELPQQCQSNRRGSYGGTAASGRRYQLSGPGTSGLRAHWVVSQVSRLFPLAGFGEMCKTTPDEVKANCPFRKSKSAKFFFKLDIIK